MATVEDELVEVYLEVIDELVEHWNEVNAKNTPLAQPAARRGSSFTSKDLARIALVKGLACYVFDTARAITTLHGSDQRNASIPLVRLAYESALNLSLLVQSLEQHGVDAFMKEYSRQRAALQSNAAKSPTDIFRQGAPDVSGVDGTAFQNTNDTVRHFESVCMDLTPGGPDAYLWYRVLSAYAHPGVSITDLYYEETGRPGIPPFHSVANEALPSGVLLFLTAASLLWSARAHSYLTNDKDDRDFLRAIGRRLGVADSLKLSQTYLQRHASQAKKERMQRARHASGGE